MRQRADPRPAAAARFGDLGCMAVALVLGGLATDATNLGSGTYAEVNDLVGLVAIAALWWRRRAPLAVAVLTFAAGAVAPMAGGAAIVSVYTVAAYHERRASLTVAAVYGAYLVSGAVSMAAFPDEDLGPAENALLAVVLTAAAFGWGLAVRSRRELLVALAERAERAEADQHARVAEARRAERARIAAEMHDVLAHRLSLLSLHAGAIELRTAAAGAGGAGTGGAGGAPPGQLAEAARVVRSTAHLALDDLRTVIGVLRDDVAGDLAPQPTIAALDSLVGECRAAGMSVEVTGALTDAARAALPTELGRHAYRVVREGLTNARKHAPGQPVQLAVTGCAGDGLRVEVVNPAPGSGSRPADTPPAIPGAGAGLIGLRERVELAGGTLDCGAEPAEPPGGDLRHRLSVWLPWPA